MSLNRTLRTALMIPVLAVVLAACAAPPYVLNADEFNRGSSEFGKDPTDISEVTICYRESSTTPRAVRALAEAECAAFGKTARLIDQDYLTCPMATPVAANFACELPPSNTGSGYYPY